LEKGIRGASYSALSLLEFGDLDLQSLNISDNIDLLGQGVDSCVKSLVQAVFVSRIFISELIVFSSPSMELNLGSRSRSIQLGIFSAMTS
jgi:hypothetical protein